MIVNNGIFEDSPSDNGFQQIRKRFEKTKERIVRK